MKNRSLALIAAGALFVASCGGSSDEAASDAASGDSAASDDGDFEYVSPLGEFLGIDEVIATKAKLDEAGRYTGEVAFNSFGKNKVTAIQASAKIHGIDLANSWAYSDSATDVPMLSAVGNPVVVNPDRELRRVAEARGWPIRRFRELAPLPSDAPSIKKRAAGGALVVTAVGAAGAVWRSGRR